MRVPSFDVELQAAAEGARKRLHALCPVRVRHPFTAAVLRPRRPTETVPCPLCEDGEVAVTICPGYRGSHSVPPEPPSAEEMEPNCECMARLAGPALEAYRDRVAEAAIYQYTLPSCRFGGDGAED